jgi:hypothetical protein
VPAPKEEGIPGEESAPRSRSGFCPAESGAAPCLPQGNLQRVLAYSRQTPRSFWSRSSIAFHLVWSISWGSPSRVSKTEQILFSKPPPDFYNWKKRIAPMIESTPGAKGEDFRS